MYCKRSNSILVPNVVHVWIGGVCTKSLGFGLDSSNLRVAEAMKRPTISDQACKQLKNRRARFGIQDSANTVRVSRWALNYKKLHFL
jgi:hypothetical protein